MKITKMTKEEQYKDEMLKIRRDIIIQIAKIDYLNN